MSATEILDTQRIHWGLWRCWFAGAWPLFLNVLPLYLAVTFSFAVLSVGLLLVLGQTVFHVFSLSSPLSSSYLRYACRESGFYLAIGLWVAVLGGARRGGPASTWPRLLRL